MPRSRRRKLGPVYSEGARQLWKHLGGGEQKDLAASLQTDSGMVARWLYGDRRPGRMWALRVEQVLGIPVALWELPPRIEGKPQTPRTKVA